MSHDDKPTDAAGEAPRPARDRAPADALLCEVAWEVCQQLGGIYTVIRSKVPTVIEGWGRRYCLVGPYDPNVSPAEFEEAALAGPLGRVVQALRDRGVEAHYGRWLVSGTPRVVLLGPASVFGHLGEIKRLFWGHHQIGLPDSPLLNQVMAFGYLVQQFFRLLVQEDRRPVIAHFHEWMASSAIPEMRRENLPVSIVFTTHATTLGRYLAPNDPWFYDHVPFIDWGADARRFGIEPQVKLERAAAHGSHVFTTLSEITAFECQHLLGRRPDLLLPNGLNIERFAAVHEFQNLHRIYKEKIHQFVMAHFFPRYKFDLDKTLYFLSSGRYEYRNKGFDMALDALASLNARLKREGTDRTIVFFLITQRPFRSINAEVLHSRAVMEEIRATCMEIKDQFGERLFLASAMGQSPAYEDLVDDYWHLRLRQLLHAWKSSRLPPIVTHDLVDDHRDEVLNQVRTCNLLNRPDDPVKVVYHPDFITSSNPLFGMDYDQFVRGCHLGIFPSYYEPWGYTPLECAARGVPAITSDLAGFGTYVVQNLPDCQERGLLVVHRRHAPYVAAMNELAQWLYAFTKLERRDRVALRNRVESTADQFDWHNLGRNYLEAYYLARERTGL
jgi:glycogen(starch) synthase